jgi:hypothetical protein
MRRSMLLARRAALVMVLVAAPLTAAAAPATASHCLHHGPGHLGSLHAFYTDHTWNHFARWSESYAEHIEC